MLPTGFVVTTTAGPPEPASFAAVDGFSVFWIFGAYANTWVMTLEQFAVHNKRTSPPGRLTDFPGKSTALRHSGNPANF